MKSIGKSEAAINVAKERIAGLYEAAQAAMQRGDDANAYALLEELLPLLEPAGELQSEHVVLTQMGRLLANAKLYEQAIELWGRAVPLAEAQGDLQGASWLLDRLASLHADRGAWRHALQRWEQALEIDARLGHQHDRAATLSNVAMAAGLMGDKLRADRCWSEALSFFEESSAIAPALKIVKAMQHVANKRNDWSDPLGMRTRVLRLAEGGGDALGQAMVLDGLGHAAAQLEKYAEALSHWERALSFVAELGEAEAATRLEDKIAQCRAELRGEKPPLDARITRLYCESVSEYALAPAAGLAFVAGEAWASLHARGVSLRGLKDGDLRVNPAGVVALSPSLRLKTGPPFDPASAAADLMAALEGYSEESSAGLLAGYSHGGYELTDRRQQGFTDAVLDHFGVPKPRLGALRTVDAESMLAELGVDLRVDRGQLSLALVEAAGPVKLWQTAPERAFVFVLALLVVGIDCRALWERDANVSWPAFELLRPQRGEAVVPEVGRERWTAVAPPGLEVVAALAEWLRLLPHPEPFNFADVMPGIHEVLTKAPDSQSVDFGDVLIDVALFCAQFLERRADLALASFLQKAAILLEYTARGQPRDELRLLVVMRALHAMPHACPAPLEAWPAEYGPWLWQWNSLLLALRELAIKSVLAQERGQVGVLRSAARRGVCGARHVLRVSYASAHSRDPDVAVSGVNLFRMTIKNYGFLLQAFLDSVRLEYESTGGSAWLPWLDSSSGPPHLVRELDWIVSLFDVASEEGFSLDAARPLMRAGAEFYAEGNCFSTLPKSDEAPN